jgi:hypothetical protein
VKIFAPNEKHHVKTLFIRNHNASTMSDQRQTRLSFTRASQSASLNNPQLVLDPPGAPQSEQDPESSPDLTQDETPETSTLATPEPSTLPLLPKKRKNNIQTT